MESRQVRKSRGTRGWHWSRTAMLVVGAPYLAVGALGLVGFLRCAAHAALYALGVLHDTQGGLGAESVGYAFVGFLAGMAALCIIPDALALIVASRRSLGALAVGVLCAVLAGTWAWFSMLPFAACMMGLAVVYGVVGLVVCELGGDDDGDEPADGDGE